MLALLSALCLLNRWWRMCAETCYHVNTVPYCFCLRPCIGTIHPHECILYKFKHTTYNEDLRFSRLWPICDNPSFLHAGVRLMLEWAVTGNWQYGNWPQDKIPYRQAQLRCYLSEISGAISCVWRTILYVSAVRYQHIGLYVASSDYVVSNTELEGH
jgi:hypothetical protein